RAPGSRRQQLAVIRISSHVHSRTRRKLEDVAHMVKIGIVGRQGESSMYAHILELELARGPRWLDSPGLDSLCAIYFATRMRPDEVRRVLIPQPADRHRIGMVQMIMRAGVDVDIQLFRRN